MYFTFLLHKLEWSSKETIFIWNKRFINEDSLFKKTFANLQNFCLQKQHFAFDEQKKLIVYLRNWFGIRLQ